MPIETAKQVAAESPANSRKTIRSTWSTTFSQGIFGHFFDIACFFGVILHFDESILSTCVAGILCSSSPSHSARSAWACQILTFATGAVKHIPSGVFINVCPVPELNLEEGTGAKPPDTVLGGGWEEKPLLNGLSPHHLPAITTSLSRVVITFRTGRRSSLFGPSRLLLMVYVYSRIIHSCNQRGGVSCESSS